MGLFDTLRSASQTIFPDMPKNDLAPLKDTLDFLTKAGQEVRKDLFELSYFNPKEIPETIIKSLFSKIRDKSLSVHEIPYPYQENLSKAKGENYQESLNSQIPEQIESTKFDNRSKLVSKFQDKNTESELKEIMDNKMIKGSITDTTINEALLNYDNKLYKSNIEKFSSKGFYEYNKHNKSSGRYNELPVINPTKAITDMFKNMSGKGTNKAGTELLNQYNKVKDNMPFNGEYLGSALRNMSLKDNARFGIKIRTKTTDGLNGALPIPSFMCQYPFGSIDGNGENELDGLVTSSEANKGGWIPCESFSLEFGSMKIEELRLGDYNLPMFIGREMPSSISLTLPDYEYSIIEEWKQKYMNIISPIDSYPLPYREACYVVSVYTYNRDYSVCTAMEFICLMDSKSNITSNGTSSIVSQQLDFKIVGYYDSSTYLNVFNNSTKIKTNTNVEIEKIPEKVIEENATLNKKVNALRSLIKIPEVLPLWITVAFNELEKNIRENNPTKLYTDKNGNSAQMQQNEQLIKDGNNGNSEIVNYLNQCKGTHKVTLPAMTGVVMTLPSFVMTLESTQWSTAFCAYCCNAGGVLINEASLSLIIPQGWVNNKIFTKEDKNKPRLGSVIVFLKKDSDNIQDALVKEGHVGFIVGGNKYAWLVLSGCQNDELNITRIKMSGDGKRIQGTNYVLENIYYPKTIDMGPISRKELFKESELKEMGYSISDVNYFQ